MSTFFSAKTVTYDIFVCMGFWRLRVNYVRGSIDIFDNEKLLKLCQADIQLNSPGIQF